jgi:hypothetical protein
VVCQRIEVKFDFVLFLDGQAGLSGRAKRGGNTNRVRSWLTGFAIGIYHSFKLLVDARQC